MTDPVETDARPLLEQLNADASRVAAKVDTDALRTQALRNQVTDIQADATEAEQDWLEVAESLDDAADECDRLRAVIENAPHAPRCVHYAATWQTIGEPCTCWKAGVL